MLKSRSLVLGCPGEGRPSEHALALGHTRACQSSSPRARLAAALPIDGASLVGAVYTVSVDAPGASLDHLSIQGLPVLPQSRVNSHQPSNDYQKSPGRVAKGVGLWYNVERLLIELLRGMLCTRTSESASVGCFCRIFVSQSSVQSVCV